MTNLLENVRKRRTKILVLLAANQMSEQPLENTFVPQDQDLVHWSSYLKNRLLLRCNVVCISFSFNAFQSSSGGHRSGAVLQWSPDCLLHKSQVCQTRYGVGVMTPSLALFSGVVLVFGRIHIYIYLSKPYLTPPPPFLHLATGRRVSVSYVHGVMSFVFLSVFWHATHAQMDAYLV